MYRFEQLYVSVCFMLYCIKKEEMVEAYDVNHDAPLVIYKGLELKSKSIVFSEC